VIAWLYDWKNLVPTPVTTRRGDVKRTLREPRYTDEQLKPFFDEVFMGYPFQEATERLGMDWKTMHNTLYSDDDIMGYALDLSIAAGALIRRGDKPVPDRKDKLYEEYRQ
jgi:hypothetical protein